MGKRIVSRAVQRQIHGSSLVDNLSKVEALASLLERPAESVRFDTLFSTDTSGWENPKAFHNACDSKGPTVTLIKASDGSAFGGFTSTSWTTGSSCGLDANAFLFRIGNYTDTHSKLLPEKYGRSGAGNEVCNNTQYGPTFGAGKELTTFNSSGICMSSNRSSFSISGPLFNASLPKTASNFQLEVLQGEAKIHEQVFEFNPANEGLPIKTVNILLCGGVGAGKSSIVSTVDSLCQQRISRRAPHGQATGSLTRILRKYSFINTATKNPIRWKLWDSMGWGATDYNKGELGFILDGHLPDKCKLDTAVSVKTGGFQMQPEVADAVHCMCLVVPCESATDDSYMQRLRDMQQFARDRGTPTLIFLTKIDKYDPDLFGEDLTKTFHSGRLLSLMEDLEGSSGVGGRKDILPIKNLSDELAPTPEASILVCRALQQALYAAVNYLRERDDMDMSTDAELK